MSWPRADRWCINFSMLEDDDADMWSSRTGAKFVPFLELAKER